MQQQNLCDIYCGKNWLAIHQTFHSLSSYCESRKTFFSLFYPLMGTCDWVLARVHEQNDIWVHPSLALKNILQALFMPFPDLPRYWGGTESPAFLNDHCDTEVPKSPLLLSATLFSPPKALLGTTKCMKIDFYFLKLLKYWHLL